MRERLSRGCTVKDVKTPSKNAAAADDGAAGPIDAWSLLTDAEWRLVPLASSGWNDRRIARAIGKTQGQVKDRFQAPLDSLGLADRLTLILAFRQWLETAESGSPEALARFEQQRAN